MQKNRDRGGSLVAILTDLSKVFDCLLHDLLIVKLRAYAFDMASLKLINTYPSGRKQRVKINGKYSLWEEILFVVPQGFILGPLLFNIFICDLFLFTNDIDIPVMLMIILIIRRHQKQIWLLKNLNSVLMSSLFT